jgi:DNA polymerase I-like protein with 3'-5' exonuclease and polymerase domains
MKAWDWVRFLCTLEGKQNVGQNYLYDANFLWTKYGIPSLDMDEDTMLLHHALQPEMEKGLDFLSTIYSDEPKWKFMRKGSFTNKRED